MHPSNLFVSHFLQPFYSPMLRLSEMSGGEGRGGECQSKLYYPRPYN